MSATRRHRADIDALRALAIGLVVAFHARIPGFEGGFIGVDVFFVVSGFLITGLLLAELEDHGSIRLGRFWARRVRRLLPASALVLVITLLATVALTSPLAWRSTAEAGLWASLYAENLFLAAEEANYFAPEIRNPFVHYWSLAIEEQFYVVWPLLLAALARIAPRDRLRTVLAGGFGVLTVASLAHSVQLTEAGSTWAYYSPLSRAWEFAVGGLLAVGWPQVRSLIAGRGGADLALPLVAALAFAGSLLTTDAFTPFPGWRAVAPVAATLLVLAADVPAGSVVGRLAALEPIQWLGRVSYGWYLWHFPLLVLAEVRLPSFGPATRLAVVTVSLLLASLSLRLVENPVRFHPALGRRHLPNLWLALGLLVGSLAVVGVVDRAGAARLDEPRFAELARAVEDFERIEDRGCPPGADPAELAGCVWGDPSGERVVLVLGDSHADQWLPALDEIGRNEGIQFVVRTVVACPALPTDGFVTGECVETQHSQSEVVGLIEPDAVIITQWTGSMLGADEQVWVDSIRGFGSELAARDIGLLWIHDPPSFEDNPIDCLGIRSEPECAPGRDEAAAAEYHRALSRSGLTTPHVEFDPIELLCDDERCRLRRAGALVFRDSNHLTAEAARTFVPELADALLETMDARSN